MCVLTDWSSVRQCMRNRLRDVRRVSTMAFSDRARELVGRPTGRCARCDRRPRGVDVARSTVLHRRRRLTRNNSALPTRRKIVFPRVGRSICRPATAATRTDGRCVPTSTEHAHCYRHLVVGSDVRRRVHGVRGRG